MIKIILITLVFIFTINCYSQPNCDTLSCPNNIEPTNVDWNKAGPATISYNGCDYYVCYCWRLVNDTVQIWVDPVLNLVNPDDPDCPDNPIPPATLAIMLKYFCNYIILNNPNNISEFLCPPCGISSKIYVTYHLDKCYVNGSPCLSGYVICINYYSICCNGPVRTVSWISLSSFSNCPPGCSENCP